MNFSSVFRSYAMFIEWKFMDLEYAKDSRIGRKNDRPGDDGTLWSVQLLVFLLGVIDLAPTSAKRLLI